MNGGDSDRCEVPGARAKLECEKDMVPLSRTSHPGRGDRFEALTPQPYHRYV